VNEQNAVKNEDESFTTKQHHSSHPTTKAAIQQIL
jgi:hypothetical protein